MSSIFSSKPALSLQISPITNEYTKFDIDLSTIRFRTGVIALGALAWSVPAMVSGFSLIARFGFSLIPPVYYQFAKWRAVSALNTLALFEFKKGSESTVAECVMKYTLDHLEILQGLTKEELEEMFKYSGNVNDLYDFLFDQANQKADIVNSSKYLSLLKALINKGLPLKSDGKNYFLSAIKSPVPELAIYILENNIIKATDLNPDELLICWNTVHDKNVARLLVQKGFDVNVKDQYGKTPLVLEIEKPNTDSNRVYLLLKNGAELPNLKRKVKNGGIVDQITIEELLKEKHGIEAALAQAQQYKTQSSTSLINEKASVFGFRKPAVWISQNTFTAMSQTITARTLIVASCVSGVVLSLAIFVPASYPATLILTALPLIYYKFEWRRATLKLDGLAVQEFQTRFPSQQVIEYISQNPKMLRSFESQKTSMDKLSDEGRNLSGVKITNTLTQHISRTGQRS